MEAEARANGETIQKNKMETTQKMKSGTTQKNRGGKNNEMTPLRNLRIA
jgi:hypothetical protein